ncbi:type IV toxin-antitoxin system AbiEi family antitoxin domain-containing protein [Trinickia sp. LjRoot230]|uniref:type IV toxin-antitoxin system AbiEi family antitoxin domain-containing protein n=1 Tax=Trinickia sp. LjRoot230 TaxID=3342288 RepID=UPI003ECFC60E
MTTPDTLVTDAQLAALVNVSPRRIRQLAESGLLERVERNQYALGASIQALLEEAAGSGSALVRERTRKLSAEATRAELALSKERGEVALISEFERVQSAKYAIIRQKIMQVPQRAVLQLLGCTQETEFKAKLKDELTLALKTAAQTEPELTDETDDDADTDE